MSSVTDSQKNLLAKSLDNELLVAYSIMNGAKLIHGYCCETCEDIRVATKLEILKRMQNGRTE